MFWCGFLVLILNTSENDCLQWHISETICNVMRRAGCKTLLTYSLERALDYVGAA